MSEIDVAGKFMECPRLRVFSALSHKRFVQIKCKARRLYYATLLHCACRIELISINQILSKELQARSQQ